MNAREHAALARTLIKACGGLMEAARACRVGKSQLGTAQDPSQDYTLPADVIVDLEAYCGRRIYSARLFETGPHDPAQGDLMGTAIALNSRAADLIEHVRLALADGRLSSREKTELTDTLIKVGGCVNKAKSELAGEI